MHRRLLPIAVTACALVCSSCGSNGLYPVTGTVRVNGEPAIGATVTFVRKGSADPLKEPTPQGTVGEDGTFTLSGPGGDGAPPSRITGTYS